MTPCEICLGPATHNCSGLDTPMLWFCETHAEEHRRICPDVKRGASFIWDTRPKPAPRREAKR